MTRINVVPPEELHDKHLLAEYRELPRVFALARAWHDRGGDVEDLPCTYMMGKGHVKFFYDKGLWLFNRQFALYGECLRRGFDVKHDPAAARDDFLSVPADLFNDWTPTPRALRINRKRIAERLATMRQAR